MMVAAETREKSTMNHMCLRVNGVVKLLVLKWQLLAFEMLHSL